MNAWVLAEVDYEDFIILGVFSTAEKAKAFLGAQITPNRDYWLEGYEVDKGYLGKEVMRDGKTWVKV